MSHRLFIALDVDEGIRRAVHKAARSLPVGEGKVNVVAAENIHVTLHFLGQVEDSRVCDVFTAAEAAAGQSGPFDFRVGELVAVPPQGRLRMVWAAVNEATGRLASLHAKLGENLRGFGFDVDSRPFKPHLTLARVKFTRQAELIRQAVAAEQGRVFGTCRADEIVVYASTLTKTGPIYQPMGRAKLGDETGPKQ